MVMSVTVRSATPDDLPRIVSCLDEEFVFGKNRKISLALRYPSVYCPANANNIFLLEDERGILSCMAAKPLRLQCDNNRWQGMMIGAVYTRPNRRGQHLGSELLAKATRELRDRQMDFAVLWTDQPGFYARLGWNPSDTGVFGQCKGQPAAQPFNGEIAELPPAASISARVESIRQQRLEFRTLRTEDDYRTLPLPAVTTQVLVTGTKPANDSYALIGRLQDTAIVYEMAGHPSGYATLWNEICRGHKKILVNDSAGSRSCQWLYRNTNVIFETKSLAMWQLFSEKLNPANTGQWYIPYFDRI
jgi:predicted N-acetyltransferase YhbS